MNRFFIQGFVKRAQEKCANKLPNQFLHTLRDSLKEAPNLVHNLYNYVRGSAPPKNFLEGLEDYISKTRTEYTNSDPVELEKVLNDHRTKKIKGYPNEKLKHSLIGQGINLPITIGTNAYLSHLRKKDRDEKTKDMTPEEKEKFEKENPYGHPGAAGAIGSILGTFAGAEVGRNHIKSLNYVMPPALAVAGLLAGRELDKYYTDRKKINEDNKKTS